MEKKTIYGIYYVDASKDICKLVYIGKTKEFKKRVSRHLWDYRGNKLPKWEYLHKHRKNIYFVTFDNLSEDITEEKMINKYCPIFNNDFNINKRCKGYLKNKSYEEKYRRLYSLGAKILGVRYIDAGKLGVKKLREIIASNKDWLEKEGHNA